MVFETDALFHTTATHCHSNRMDGCGNRQAAMGSLLGAQNSGCCFCCGTSMAGAIHANNVCPNLYSGFCNLYEINFKDDS